MFDIDNAKDAAGTPLRDALNSELTKVRDALQTLAWLVEGNDADTARRILRAAASGFDQRLVTVVDAYVGFYSPGQTA